MFAHQCGTVLNQLPIAFVKGGRKVAVDVEFADDLSAHVHRDHNF